MENSILNFHFVFRMSPLKHAAAVIVLTLRTFRALFSELLRKVQFGGMPESENHFLTRCSLTEMGWKIRPVDGPKPTWLGLVLDRYLVQKCGNCSKKLKLCWSLCQFCLRAAKEIKVSGFFHHLQIVCNFDVKMPSEKINSSVRSLCPFTFNQ